MIKEPTWICRAGYKFQQKHRKTMVVLMLIIIRIEVARTVSVAFSMLPIFCSAVSPSVINARRVPDSVRLLPNKLPTRSDPNSAKGIGTTTAMKSNRQFVTSITIKGSCFFCLSFKFVH